MTHCHSTYAINFHVHDFKHVIHLSAVFLANLHCVFLVFAILFVSKLSGSMSSEITDDLLTLQKDLKVGDLSSRHLAEEMRKKYESKIDQLSSCDVELLNALAEDQLSSALLPSEEKGMKALQTTGDGNCLYNSASVLIEGDQSANLILRLLTTVELYLNPDYYAEHSKLADGRSSGFSHTSIFTLLLSDSAQKEFERQASRVDAVQAQAIITCKEKKYRTLLR